MSDIWKSEKLGQTQDDAAGEAYDKVAKMMEL
jgi:tRNA A37 threonylcarbamoyltransferase TsaD